MWELCLAGRSGGKGRHSENEEFTARKAAHLAWAVGRRFLGANAV